MAVLFSPTFFLSHDARDVVHNNSSFKLKERFSSFTWNFCWWILLCWSSVCIVRFDIGLEHTRCDIDMEWNRFFVYVISNTRFFSLLFLVGVGCRCDRLSRRTAALAVWLELETRSLDEKKNVIACTVFVRGYWSTGSQCARAHTRRSPLVFE